MERLQYFVRRLLLIVPTFLGITIVAFTLCQFVPGGPVEQAMIRMRGIGGVGESRAGSATTAITEAQRQALEKHFHFDRPVPVRYALWLWRDRIGLRADSYMYPNKTVWGIIRERFPVSIVFGLTGFALAYLICIPLGIAKALRHGAAFDVATSAIVFAGYAIPPVALGMILKTLFAGTSDRFWDVFPSSGFHALGFETLSLAEKARDLLMHMTLPVLCYVIGHFALLTLLMKNSLLEQIGQDYVRAVLARGATRRRAVWAHALRNSLIPIATGFGGILSVVFAGSVIIERMFELPGMGKLSLDAVVGRDYMVFMGVLAVTSLLALVGRILSDFCYVLIDPRIQLHR
jgi:microcin C transport system permease protein